MGTNVAPVSTPILQFLNNAGQLNVGGSLLTQVGGVNYPTYQDAAGTTALPNPIPLNSRGEISNTSGVSVPLYLIPSVVYTFTLYDANNNVIWVDDNVVAQGATAVGQMTDELGSDGTPGFKAGTDFTPGTTQSLTLSGFYGTTANLWVAFDAAEQGANSYQLSGHTLTFGSYSGSTFTPGPIPIGTNAVFVKGGTTSTIGTPGAGSVTDATVAANAAIQSTKLAYVQAGGGVTQTVQGRLRKRVYVTDYPGVDPTGATDSATGIAAAWAYVSANPQQFELVFTQGIYVASVFPNFAINHARVIAEGEVRLRYSGSTGNAIVIDAGSSSTNVYDVTFGTPGAPFIVEVENASAGHAVFVRAVHHSTFAIKPRSAGTSSAGLQIDFSVCSRFYVTCSVNEDGGFYNSLTPEFGIFATQRNAGEQISYCLFDSPIIEGPTNGIWCDYSQGCVFISGTAEDCSDGVVETANAIGNVFIGMDMENNSIADIATGALQSSYIRCDTAKLTSITGNDIKIDGGLHSQINIGGSALYTRLRDLRYNRGNNGATISDAGTLTTKSGCVNYGTGLLDGPAAAFAITPSAGTYTNNKAVNVGIAMTGGTVTNVTLTRGGTGTTVYSGASLGSGIFETSPGDVLTWSGTPSVANGYPRVGNG